MRENPSWGYQRGSTVSSLGIEIAPSTVWEILKQAELDPAPERASTTWADFPRSQADAMLACDFIEIVTLSGQRQYILAVIEHATRRVRVLGTTAHPSATWVIQAIKPTPTPRTARPSVADDGDIHGDVLRQRRERWCSRRLDPVRLGHPGKRNHDSRTAPAIDD
ncbi:hypothetical protein [Nonomuraea jiangxiensis]|uniref:hypothetical protein n=1 Tax=Nonomuraea jiangxiensis TaxID=633440 RepID=UPI001C40AFE0|nr:hypothetical protein [Nonomuraea jiangxiensis]